MAIPIVNHIRGRARIVARCCPSDPIVIVRHRGLEPAVPEVLHRPKWCNGNVGHFVVRVERGRPVGLRDDGRNAGEPGDSERPLSLRSERMDRRGSVVMIVDFVIID